MRFANVELTQDEMDLIRKGINLLASKIPKTNLSEEEQKEETLKKTLLEYFDEITGIDKFYEVNKPKHKPNETSFIPNLKEPAN